MSGALLDAVVQEKQAENPSLDPSSLLTADPFAGGGVIPLSALVRGHRVYAQDLNPWVAQGLSVMLGLPKSTALKAGAKDLLTAAENLAHRAYGTCFTDGAPAQMVHSLRVAVAKCPDCSCDWKLYPHALTSLTRRKDRDGVEAWLACRRGHLFKGNSDRHCQCPDCDATVDPSETYLVDRMATCPGCGAVHRLSALADSWKWVLCLVERSDGLRREIDLPTAAELELSGDEGWRAKRTLGDIPDTAESRVLRRHGFRTWSDLYPARQRHVMERLLALPGKLDTTEDVRKALKFAVLGTAEMAGHLSRWDRFYLKAYESMASHRFNFTTLTAEPNLIGVGRRGRGALRGRLNLFQRAAEWLEDREISSPASPDAENAAARIQIVEGSSEQLQLADNSVDVILTDPPYHDDVQYHELSLPLRAWAGLTRIRQSNEAVAIPHSTSLSGHRRYRDVLMRIFRELHRVIRPDGRLVFSYANREPAAWVNLFAALKGSGFQPLAYTVVHSENEMDHGKRQGRACNLDLILELVPLSPIPLERWRPRAVFETDEERFLRVVGDAFLESGSMVNGWEVKLVERLRSEIFVRGLQPEGAIQLAPDAPALEPSGDPGSLSHGGTVIAAGVAAG